VGARRFSNDVPIRSVGGMPKSPAATVLTSDDPASWMTMPSKASDNARPHLGITQRCFGKLALGDLG
jgi:hypothetical protein